MAMYLLVDTNWFLHYRSLEQVDWCKLAGASRVTLVVEPVVIRELNKHKDSHPIARLRKRAASALRKLAELTADGNPASINASVGLHLQPIDPQVDFSEHQLRTEVSDDFLIAGALALRVHRPDDSIQILSADIGLKLKSQHHGLSCVIPPDDLKLPEEPDPNDQKVRQLEEEIRSLRHRMPQLALRFQNDTDRVTASLTRAQAGDVDDRVKRIRKEHPKMPPVDLPRPTSEVARLLNFIGRQSLRDSLATITQDQLDEYNRKLDAFYEQMRHHYQRVDEFEDFRRRWLQLDVKLVNTGGATASDIMFTCTSLTASPSLLVERRPVLRSRRPLLPHHDRGSTNCRTG